MKKAIRTLLFAFLCAAAYSACQRASEEKKVGERQQTIDSLEQSFQTLNDSLETRWEIIVAEEDRKLKNMRRLLQEISSFPVYNRARLDTLLAQLEQVYAMRFDPETMTSAQIDRYDSASSVVKNRIVRFALEHPDVEEQPLVSQLIDSIENADQKILFYRVQYDNYVRDYNAFLEGNRDFFREIDTTGLFRERTLFQLSE